jgi:hypothetical protein
MSEKLSVCQVQLELIPSTATGELSDDVFRKCCFCEKRCCFGSNQLHLITKLSGPDNFYCSFCLRHGLNNKSNRDVLILSFRSLIGYFYFQNYLQNKKFWISQIEDYIDSHYQAGSVNPLFLYDPETMLWFINFSKVGNSKKKIPVEEIFKTVLSILTTFNLYETMPNINMASLYVKYKDAIDSFYRKRFRPVDRRMLIPTPVNTGESNTCNLEKIKNFVFEDLRIKNFD